MDIKRSYYEDIELFKSKTVLVWSLILFAFLIILPWIVGNKSEVSRKGYQRWRRKKRWRQRDLLF